MKALITGITGQDGYYLTELLLEKGYEVYGLVRSTNTRVENVEIIYGDITALPSLPNVDEVYNLAAMSHVAESFRMPKYAMEVNATGAVSMMSYAARIGAKFYQASTSELYGDAPPPQTITTPMTPVSPYGVAKLAAHYHVKVMRRMGNYACSGILFNHESPRRGINFVTQKIAYAVNAIADGRQDRLYLGNLSGRRDWGHAKDYVRGMWQIMQQETPDDHLLATGITHTVEEFVELAFSLRGLDWRNHVSIDKKFVRPNEVPYLHGVSSAAFWHPEITFEQLVKEMVEAAND